MHLQVRSSQQFVLLVNKSSQVTTLSNNIGEKNGAKQRKPSDTVAVLNKIVETERKDGGKLNEEISACQLFLLDTDMENGDIKS